MRIASTIEYEGDNKTVVWKHPMVDFNNGTHLIVHESQEAIFYLNGEALDSFGKGEHLLETGRIPLLSKKLFGKLVDGEIFHSEVYFVNLVEQMSIKWGTKPKIRFVDRTNNNCQFDLGIYGEMSVQVEKPRVLIQKLVGTEDELGQERLISYFEPMLMQKIRTVVVKKMSELNISIFEIEEHTEEIAEYISNAFEGAIGEYGLKIVGFWIRGFEYPEDDEIYKKIKELRGQKIIEIINQDIDHTIKTKELAFNKTYIIDTAQLKAQEELIEAEKEKQKKILEALGNAKAREVEGYTKQEEMAHDILSKAAANEGTANYSNPLMGVSMISGMAPPIANAISEISTQTIGPLFSNKKDDDTSHQGFDFQNPEMISLAPDEESNETKFATSDDALVEKNLLEELMRLQEDLASGVISQEEYIEKSKRLTANTNS